LVFEKNANFQPKLAKIAQNSDHNIDPRSAAFDDLSTSTIIIVAVSASLLVGSLLAAALLVVYCRRVKVGCKVFEACLRSFCRTGLPDGIFLNQKSQFG
jgi:hypothetical protein